MQISRPLRADTTRHEVRLAIPAIARILRSSRGLAFLVLLVAALTTSTVVFAARWDEDYVAAVEMIDAGGCPREAILLLGAALDDEKRPRLNARRKTGVRAIDYLPYYQLARAHLACGELEPARYYLGQSRDAGAAPEEMLAALENEIEARQSAAATPTQPSVSVEELTRVGRQAAEEVREARSMAAQIDVLRSDDRYRQLFADNARRLQEGANHLDEAERALDDGMLRQDLATIEKASGSARRAMQIFTDIEARIAAVPTATPVIRPPQPTATPPAAATPRPTPVPTMPPARPSPSPTNPVPVLPTPRPREVPASLRRAAADYLDGRYEEVIRALEPGALGGSTQQAAAHLLRAAAQFALYRIGGSEDRDLLQKARAELVQCRSLDPGVRPDPRLFSPGFVDLYRESH